MVGIEGVDLFHGFADAVIGDMALAQFAADAVASPFFHAEFTAGVGAGEAFFVEEVLGDEVGDDLLQVVPVDAEVTAFFPHLLVAAILVDAVPLELDEGIVPADPLFLFWFVHACRGF